MNHTLATISLFFIYIWIIQGQVLPPSHEDQQDINYNPDLSQMYQGFAFKYEAVSMKMRHVYQEPTTFINILHDLANIYERLAVSYERYDFIKNVQVNGFIARLHVDAAIKLAQLVHTSSWMEWKDTLARYIPDPFKIFPLHDKGFLYHIHRQNHMTHFIHPTLIHPTHV